jgi:hypothetical protein
MRQRFVQVLGKPDDSDLQDPIVGRFWVQAKPLARPSLPRTQTAAVVDLAQWVIARGRGDQ